MPNPVGEFIVTFFDIGGYYSLQNALYWLFGFKYWVIARQIPEMLKDEDE